MRLTEPPRRALRQRLADDPTGSRWWYWVASVPLAFGLWVVTIAWLAVALVASPLAEPTPLARAAELSMVAFGVPLFALVVVFPFAVHADASAVLAAGVGWQPRRAVLTGAAAVGPAITVAATAFGLLTEGGVAVGFVLTLPVALVYLRDRHRRLAVP